MDNLDDKAASLIGIAALLILAASPMIWLMLSWERRRLLYARWRRLVRWEFWPMACLYPPVVAYILYLGLRYRCLTLFTASNPAIPHSGVALMSKSAILQGLSNDSGQVARFATLNPCLSVNEKEKALLAFMESYSLSFPIILKPDYGERGKGVLIAQDIKNARAYFSGCPDKIIAQECVKGVEFGVFYSRYPNSESGEIVSITEKRPTQVVGDGSSSLQTLILRDSRAVCMAPYFLEKHRKRLTEIVPSGEVVRLSALGTHSRGAIFLDAGHLHCQELDAAFDRLSKSFDGFFFGRYDVIASSPETFSRGENFKAVELNGVTSEPTHMYDPKHSVFYAWRTMMQFWKMAFEIGDQNRSRGVAPSSFTSFAKLVARLSKRKSYEA